MNNVLFAEGIYYEKGDIFLEQAKSRQKIEDANAISIIEERQFRLNKSAFSECNREIIELLNSTNEFDSDYSYTFITFDSWIDKTRVNEYKKLWKSSFVSNHGGLLSDVVYKSSEARIEFDDQLKYFGYLKKTLQDSINMIDLIWKPQACSFSVIGNFNFEKYDNDYIFKQVYDLNGKINWVSLCDFFLRKNAIIFHTSGGFDDRKISIELLFNSLISNKMKKIFKL